MATSNDRDGKRGSALPADFDDPSIPVLTERLTLPPLDLDFTLPPALTQPAPAQAPRRATAPVPAPMAADMLAPPPASATAYAPPPAIHGLDTLPPQPLAPAAVSVPGPASAPTSAMAARFAPSAEPRTETQRAGEPNWATLETELRESVLRELSMRLPQNVEQVVREKMQPGIQAALDRLAAETRLAIAASLRDLVDKAVKAELAAMKQRGK
jgi:hypothetical protein